MDIKNPNNSYTPLKKKWPFLSGSFRKLLIDLHTIYRYRKYYFNNVGNNKPNQKFFLVSVQRSGSSLLGSLIASNPNIAWHGEAYQFNSFRPVDLAESFAGKTKYKTFGAKLFLSEMNREDKFVTKYLGVLNELEDKNWKFISLIRENSLKQALSFYIFVNGGKGYVLKGSKMEKKKKIHVDIEQFHKMIRWCESFKETQDKMMEHIPHIRIVYERDLADTTIRDETMKKVFNYLNVPEAKTTTKHAKQSADKLEDQIENYEELIGFLDINGYGKYKY